MLKRAILATFLTLTVVIGAGLTVLGQAPAAKPSGPVPTFQADPTWPPALPNNWVMGAVASVACVWGGVSLAVFTPRWIARHRAAGE